VSGQGAYHVGHLNVAVLSDDWGSETVADFENALWRVNAIAERSDGFVLNVTGEAYEAQAAASDHPLTDNPRLAATLSVWENAAALDHFVHKTLHGAFLRRRAEWFEKIAKPSYVVWPIPAGHVPTLDEAMQRLALLGENGPSSEAFDLEWFRMNRNLMEVEHA